MAIAPITIANNDFIIQFNETSPDRISQILEPVYLALASCAISLNSAIESVSNSDPQLLTQAKELKEKLMENVKTIADDSSAADILEKQESTHGFVFRSTFVRGHCDSAEKMLIKARGIIQKLTHFNANV